MFASLVYDAFAGLGCITVSFAVTAFAAVCLALWLGLLPEVAEPVQLLGQEAPDGP